MVELRVTVRREAEAVVRKQIADRGEKVWHYLPMDIANGTRPHNPGLCRAGEGSDR